MRGRRVFHRFDSVRRDREPLVLRHGPPRERQRNIGAANALRSLGAKGGAAVLALDALKGFIPTYAAALLVPPLGIAAVAAIAFATIAGHCYSPWLRFAGGKGVATLLGALLALWWPAGLIFIAAWSPFSGSPVLPRRRR